jgi:hypothetical protein
VGSLETTHSQATARAKEESERTSEESAAAKRVNARSEGGKTCEPPEHKEHCGVAYATEQGGVAA